MTALTLGGRGGNLPSEVTRFIGRRRELSAVSEAIARHRLVTLRGTGGIGKTRIALRAAADLSDGFADGCWLVQLSPLRSPGLVARTVAETLGLPHESGDSSETLAQGLAGHELLLVLDTCEHLTGACADLARLLLDAAPGLRVLATSRSPLGLPDEQTLLITPLEVPATSDAAAARSDAISLFVDRATAAVPDFALTPQNTPAVIELCRRLDGIPLALELAAVRLRGMPVEEMLARLTDRFRVLGATRSSTGRHRTLRAAFYWSYELCTPAEQRLWAELSVFPDSFRVAAAEHVAGPGAGQTLDRLVEKSVVQLPAAGTASHPARETADVEATRADLRSVADDRYRLLDTMREFGAELLAAAGAAEVTRVRARHRDYCLGLAERAAAGAMTAEQPAWLAKLGVEIPNLRVALDFSFATPGEEPAGLRMTRLLQSYWLMTGQFTEGRRWHDLAIAVNPGSPDNAWAVFGAGMLAVQQGDFAAGAPLLARAAELAEATADADLAAHVTDARGTLAFYSGDLPTARAEYEAALGGYERDGFTDPAALVTYTRLASACLLTVEIDRAMQLCEECLRRCDELGEQWARSTALWVRGAARWLSGDAAGATQDALACLRVKRPLGDLHTIAMCLDLLSVCLVAEGDLERAATLHGASERLWTLLNAPVLMGPAYAEIRKSAADSARDALGPQRFEELTRHGYTVPLSVALAVASGEAPAAPTAPGATAPRTEPRSLTRREHEIAALVAEGLANREIAERLFLSKRTVDSHMEHIFAKLGISSRTRLAAWVLERTDPTPPTAAN